MYSKSLSTFNLPNQGYRNKYRKSSNKRKNKQLKTKNDTYPTKEVPC